MVGEAVRGSVVARLFGRMMGIGLAIGDVTATTSVYEEKGRHGAPYRFVRSRHMFAGQLGASSQAASGQLLPVWSDE
jgi:hypothetical protein